eukprot:TRINITY_DN1300_c0_g1_i5.p2 TRINITY_DN1300_c0_g1~~TRINITY_DN1300_c0_g1_i5.p2  ORF type:complete len:368 (-),score=48.47 TRINITY_DN1300_c0_g1_i5:486-1454(-)
MVYYSTALLFILAVSHQVICQSSIIAGATARVGNNVAAGLAQATGQTAAGSVTTFVTRNSAAATATAIATGTPSLRMPMTAIPIVHRPAPTPSPKMVYLVTPVKYHPVPVPTKKVVKSEPKCEDVYDCYKMDTVKYCGYCIQEKYPTKGYGCVYEEVYGKRDTEYVPKCTCDGSFIYKKSACPSCDSVLVELLECAGKQHASDKVEIPEDCLKKVVVSLQYLEECGYSYHPDSPTPSKKVVVYTPPTKYHPTPTKYHPTPTKYHPIPTPTPPESRAPAASAQASAAAVAVGGGAAAAADASAIAIGGGALAAANARAIAIGN